MSDETVVEDFFAINVDDAVEASVCPADTEATVEVMEAVPNPEKRFIRLKLRILGDDFFRTFSHFLFFPKPDDDAEKVNNKKLMIKQFAEAFQVPLPLRNPGDLVGRTASVLLGVETQEKYGDRNNIKRYTGLKS